MADIIRRGYRVALPFGEDWRCDIIVQKGGRLEKVQCKYTESKNGVISVICRNCNHRSVKKYSSGEVDWIACYDNTTDKCYYVPSSFLGDGRAQINLRLYPPKNNQRKRVLFASEFLKF